MSHQHHCECDVEYHRHDRKRRNILSWLVEARNLPFRTYTLIYIVYYIYICIFTIIFAMHFFQSLAGVACSTLIHSVATWFCRFRRHTCVKLSQIWWSLSRQNAQIEFALAARGDKLAADRWIFVELKTMNSAMSELLPIECFFRSLITACSRHAGCD